MLICLVMLVAADAWTEPSNRDPRQGKLVVTQTDRGKRSESTTPAQAHRTQPEPIGSEIEFRE